jgi:mRNA-binding protein PUF3
MDSSSNINADRTRSSNAGFPTTKERWSKIWSNSNIGGPFNTESGPDGTVNRGQNLILAKPSKERTNSLTLCTENAFQGKTGSSSLLATSESDGWAGRHSFSWNPANASTLGNNSMNTSPVESRPGDRNASARGEIGDPNSYFALSRTSAIGQNPSASISKGYLGSVADNYTSPTDNLSFGNLGNFDAASQRQLSSFPANPAAAAFQRKSSVVSNVSTARDPQRTEDVMGSMNMSPFSHVPSESMAGGSTRQNAQNAYPHIAQMASQRPSHSAHPSYHSDTHGLDSRFSTGQIDIGAGLNRLQLNDNASIAGYSEARRASYANHGTYDSTNRFNGQLPADEANYQGMATYTGDVPTEFPISYQHLSRLGERDPSPTAEYVRGINSPFYPSVGTPPVLRPSSGHRMSVQVGGEGQTALLDRKLRGLQQDQDYSQVSGRVSFPGNYELSGYSNARLNSYSPYLQMPFGGGLSSGLGQRVAHRDPDPSQVVRSPLLEEFRTHNKSNKRYELKVS